MFRGSTVDQLICRDCGFTRSSIQHFYNLSVEVKNKASLDQSLTKMLEEQEISDYKCEGCEKRGGVYKRSMIGETPNVLFVHLQRIVFSFDTYNNEKINSKFEFPNTLDLKPFSYSGKISETDDEQLKPLLEASDSSY